MAWMGGAAHVIGFYVYHTSYGNYNKFTDYVEMHLLTGIIQILGIPSCIPSVSRMLTPFLNVSRVRIYPSF